MLTHEVNSDTVFVMPSSNLLLLGHKWKKNQSNVREGNVTRQHKLQLEGLNSDTSHQDDDEYNTDEYKEKKKKMTTTTTTTTNHLMAGQLVSSLQVTSCPLEMQSVRKASLVNLSPATRELRRRRIDANACALRHSKCDDECKVVMTVDLGKVVEEVEEEEESLTTRSEPSSSSFTKSTDSIVTNCISGTEATGPQLEVKSDCLSATVSDKSDELNGQTIQYFMQNFVKAIFTR